MRISFDIFCRVIDNYGDIGVCWRLARRLMSLAGCGSVRLWVDDLHSFARIAPGVSADAARQSAAGVTIVKWSDDTSETPADVVIEAFACSPPESYLRRMTDAQVWINLEYLSAESWVESCHALPSLQPNGLRKFFFFPGFTPRTGGLLREAGLFARRDAWRAVPDARSALLATLGVPQAWLDRLRQGAMLVYVYCYPQAPLPALSDALSRAGRDALILIPGGIWPGTLPEPRVTAHGTRVETVAHPFVDQDTFDRLLWGGDLNIVRGEDSLVRALWAGRAMIWQPYLQEGDTHFDKLDAWLALSPFPSDVQNVVQAWNRGDAATVASQLPPLLTAGSLARWGAHTDGWAKSLATSPDLAENLFRFCAEKSKTS